MLAKVIRGTPKTSATIDWPTAGGPTGAFPVLIPKLSNSKDGQGDIVSELTAEVVALRAEVSRLMGEVVSKAQEAHANGRAEGEAAARLAAEQQVEAEVSKLRVLMKEVRASGPKLRRDTEEELVRLAVAVARRIVHRELTVDPHALSGLIKVAFDKLDQREVQQIRTDQGSLEVVRKIAGEIGGAGSIRVVVDPNLRVGSLLIEFPKGQLDASVDTQLAEIERGFVDIVRNS